MKIIAINKCCECPYLYFKTTYWEDETNKRRGACWRKQWKKVEDRYGKIPDWCPLDNNEEYKQGYRQGHKDARL